MKGFCTQGFGSWREVRFTDWYEAHVILHAPELFPFRVEYGLRQVRRLQSVQSTVW